MKKIRVGTRSSPMALHQADLFCDDLREAYPGLWQDDTIEIVPIKSSGDKFQDKALSRIGGKGLFIKEFEEALQDDLIDVAVHSMKDVPSIMSEGFLIAAYLERSDARDSFISPHADSLENLPEGAVVGTAAPRRKAITLSKRPDLKVVTFRGNADTRLEKISRGDVDATYLSYCGLERLNKTEVVTKIMEVEDMLPGCGQGAIGIEVLASRNDIIELLRPVNHIPTYQRVTAERRCLEVLDGHCHSPLAAYSIIEDQEIYIRALAAREDGSEMIEDEIRGPLEDYDILGQKLGEAVLSKLPEDFFQNI